MNRILILSGLAAWVGITLLLSEQRWFSRRPLADRLRLFTPGGTAGSARSGLLSVESFREVIAPLSQSLGSAGARFFGVSEELAVRLRRIHSPLDVTQFRVRQIGVSLTLFGIGTLTSIAFRLPAPLAVVLILAGPVLAFLIQEQQIASRSERRQRRVMLELPIVAEQLGMLLSSGYSLGAALQRVGTRGSGAVAEDLRIVVGRMRQGLSDVQALREWAAIADVDALDRLVAILGLNREAGDLGRLIHEEARSIRREVQRELMETIERRSQQVWIPVTVATLLPGAILIAIPFVEALRAFSEV